LTGIFYEETATAITGAFAGVAVTIAAPFTETASEAVSKVTLTSTTWPTGDDKWILNQTNSALTIATPTTMGVEGGISKNMLKATAETWTKKEEFMAACQYAGAVTASTTWVPTAAKASTVSDWIFMDGAAATMAGASLVAAAALLF
jgi:hypothetical protein